MHARVVVGLALCGVTVASAELMPRVTEAPTATADAPEITAVTSCHPHDTDLYCMAGDEEFLVKTTLTATNDYPESLTDCHSHGADLYCVDADGNDVGIEGAGGPEGDGHDHEHEGEEEEEESSGNLHCHDHAGIPHCTGGSAEEETTCDMPAREYNIKLRVGLLFAILATSGLGVFAPIVLQKLMPNRLNLLFVMLKQFGTGIVISTAFIHLYTHAALMFANPCIGDLGYEGTTAAILMAGLFVSFLVEYIGQRVVSAKIKAERTLSFKERSSALLSGEVVGILVMETGIVFHSLLIGLTLVVSGDQFFITLFIVIVFHQMFEGIALGTRIAALGTLDHSHEHATAASAAAVTVDHDASKSVQPGGSGEESSMSGSSTAPAPISLKRKLALASVFAFITPIGMAIGIGVLGQFNGNDKSTLVAIGTLDALSAGILVWVGVVEMWAGDWMTGSHGHPAELADADALTVAVGGFGLVAGLVVMSVLGKWA
ncbi:hypothetical protein N3K66_003812 [Trichothecium roseum]|uniref:Uncharacterized protein n=1 Tax=Trichothecium roseum TaxID=47278 RepID=A0ACC0V6J0_9HYPO|nr:hypothetical protein N3K66_003812 [Trichothecium roseum]